MTRVLRCVLFVPAVLTDLLFVSPVLGRPDPWPNTQPPERP